MQKIVYYFLIIVLFSSCAKKGSFQHFYNEHKRSSDIALAFPKYMAMIAVPGDAKEEVKYFTKGMKKIRVLVNDEQDVAMGQKFNNFIKSDVYDPYVLVKKDGTQFSIYAREKDDMIREIILNISAEEGDVVVGILGKMDKATFREAMQEAQKNNN